MKITTPVAAARHGAYRQFVTYTSVAPSLQVITSTAGTVLSHRDDPSMLLYRRPWMITPLCCVDKWQSNVFVISPHSTAALPSAVLQKIGYA